MNYSTFRHLEPGAKLCLIQKGEKKEPKVDQPFFIKRDPSMKSLWRDFYTNQTCMDRRIRN